MTEEVKEPKELVKPYWKYNPKSEVKHCFRTSPNYSICGTGLLWYSREQWQDDDGGLELRRKCKRCRDLDNKDN